MKSLLVVVVLVAAACASWLPAPEAMRPTEHRHGTTKDGRPLALYRMPDASVKIWSRGAFEAALDGADRNVVHVAFDIANPTNQPIDLDPERLAITQLVTNDGTFAE